MNKTKNYLIFWISQTVSQLGSSMTSYALIIWAYMQTKSVLSTALMTFFSFAPKALVSIFAGGFVDKYSKKKIIMVTDSISAICSLAVCLLFFFGEMQIWYIYIINIVLGFMEALQSPASSVAFGMIVPKDKYEKASGLYSISDNLITVVYAMFAAALMSFWGISSVLLFDIGTYIFAFFTMMFFVKIPNNKSEEKDRRGIFEGFKDGVKYLKENKGVYYIIICMTLLSFLSRLTYENILTPMIFARSNDNFAVLGIVTSIIGFSGIIGGFIITIMKMPKNKVKMLFYSAAFSFLFGDILMGLGQNIWVWGIAAVAASLPIPFVFAAQSVLIYSNVPVTMQGRVFAAKNAARYTAIPIAIILGGVLADSVFMPFMDGNSIISEKLRMLVGNTAGSGMGVMFLCTGILGFTSCIILSSNKYVKNLKFENMEDK